MVPLYSTAGGTTGRTLKLFWSTTWAHLGTAFAKACPIVAPTATSDLVEGIVSFCCLAVTQEKIGAATSTRVLKIDAAPLFVFKVSGETPLVL